MLPRDKGGVVDPHLNVCNHLRSYPHPSTYWRAITRGRQVYGTARS